ncbi:hypothetical protein [Hydrogenivirga sp. 128-5-R1-1]|uniref:hypothetical protein n=1 Tax=Hydrogenivirga sp. 128-5-R1-1 TaxID=392423 RepID=UPI00015EF18A|nr:hypothetical protein [Hydrogenivirga sp. 128-5-R1-1]EDP73944.1 hypothetical protein HG1285_04538 [Hydrogenivirga sp. 128-5-R1-1]
MEKTTLKKEPDVKFEEVRFKCKCGHEGKEVIPVAENTGVLDTKCPKCSRRILEIRIFDTN